MSVELSVILPVYNAEKYVEDAIQSILNQTYSDFELIIINDGSTDESIKKIQKYSNNPKVTIVNRENRGLSCTLNEGAELAQGQFYARMDADDIALPARFEKQMQFLTSFDADICGTAHRLFGAQERDVLFPKQDEEIKASLIFNSPFSHPTVIMKTVLVKKLKYDSSFNGAEDYDFWERAARAGAKMYNLEEVLYLYRIHEKQFSTASYSKQRELGHKIRIRALDFVEGKFNLTKNQLRVMILPREGRIKCKQSNELYTASLILQSRLSFFSESIYKRITQLFYMSSGEGFCFFLQWIKFNKKVKQKLSVKSLLIFSVIVVFRLKYGSKKFDRLMNIFYKISHG